jgi:hypothetical protein
MRRKRPLLAEMLEVRALLSSLSYTLTTNQPVYQVGQPIQITFTETNTGNQPVSVEVRPTDFTVSQNGYAIWQSDPANQSQPPAAETLQPGQTITQTATWNGMTPYASAEINDFGSFSVTNPNGPSASSASFQITDPVIDTLTTDQAVYELGQPVTETFTEVNTASVPVTIANSPSAEAFLIYRNGTALWLIAYPQVISFSSTTLNPGQAHTESQTLDVIPQSGPWTLANVTGTFDAAFGPENDPTEYTAPFQVDAPSADDLVTSVTTDQSTYTLGQTVNLTFTETNDGSSPLPILTGATNFQISQNGTPIWASTSPVTTPRPTWTTLQPGQSYTQTASWNGSSNVGTLSNLAGSFTVTNELDPNGDTAAFQFTQPSSQLTTSLTTDQSVYQLGQPINLTFTETNNGTTPLQVLTGPASFNITQNGAVVWTSNPVTSPPTTQDSWTTLQPGQSVTQTATWNGVPARLPAAYSNGTFTVTDSLDPRADSASFQIVAPPPADLTSTITTDQSVYDYGQPVHITLTESNTGTEPIVVLTGPTAFAVSYNGAVEAGSLSATSLPASTSWETLQPGQSYVQTWAMDGANYVPWHSEGPNSFTVTNLLDPNQASATFQVISPVSVPPNLPVQPPGTNPISVPPNVPVPLPVSTTLVSSQNAYKPDQTVHLTMTLKNTTAAKVGVTPDTEFDGITVTEGTKIVYESSRVPSVLAARGIKPHKSIKLALAWSGRPNQSGISRLSPGTYRIQVVDGGFVATTMVRIKR